MLANVTLSAVIWQLWIFSWYPLVHLSAALMHPYFKGNRLARRLRYIIAVPAVYTALTFYRHYRFPDRHRSLNFTVIGGLCGHYAALALQYAFVDGPYFRPLNKKKDDDADKKKDDDTEKKGAAGAEKKSPAMIENTVNPSFGELFGFPFALIGSSRGVGWNIAPPERVLPRPAPEPWAPFVRRMIPKTIALHLSLLACNAILVPSGGIWGAPYLWTYYIGGEPPEWFRKTAWIAACYAFGCSLWATISLRARLGVVVAGGIHGLARLVSPTPPAPFDTTMYPDVFYGPSRATSLDDIWTYRWHCITRRDGMCCGAVPMQFLFGWMGRDAKRLAGIWGAFLYNGLMHEYSLWIAQGYDPRWLTTRYMVGQATGITLEHFYHKFTGRRVGGVFGWFWWTIWMYIWGSELAHHWLQLQHDAPMPHEWGWKAWLLPDQATVPPPTVVVATSP